jgi:hypothetical protein
MTPMQSEPEPRDVLADRIQKWATDEDWHVYDYVDRLIKDLDAAGYEIMPKRKDAFTEHPEGAVLLLAVYLPDESAEHNDPDEAADSLLAPFNKARYPDASRDEKASINLWPQPQWLTRAAMERLRGLAEAPIGEGDD